MTQNQRSMLTATRTLILFPDSSSSPSSSSSSSNIRHSCIPRPRSQGSGSACLHCRAFQHHSQVEVYFHMITYSNGIGGAKAVTLAPLQNMRTQEPRGTSLPEGPKELHWAAEAASIIVQFREQNLPSRVSSAMPTASSRF